MSGILDWFESLKGEVNEKSRNPFFATFIFVWTIRHWEAVYSFFFFDEDFKLDQRIERFKCYFEDYSYWTLLETVGITFGVIVTGYFLGNVTRIISNFFEFIVTPNIYRITNSSKIVMKSELDELQRDYDVLEKKYDAIRIERNNLANEIEELHLRKSKGVNPDNDKEFLLKYGFSTQEKKKKFKEIAISISKSNKLNKDSEEVAEFFSLGLIVPKYRNDDHRDQFYNLTPEGQTAFRILSKE